MGVFDLIRAGKTADVELPSGLWGTVQLLRVQDFIAAGDMPMPVLEAIRSKVEQNGDVNEADLMDTLSSDDLKHSMHFNDRIVTLTLIRLGKTQDTLEPVELSMDDVKFLDADDCTEVVAYAMRTKALPGKAA